MVARGRACVEQLLLRRPVSRERRGAPFDLSAATVPYLVGHVVEVLEPDAEDGLDTEEGAGEEGGMTDANAQRRTCLVVVRTSTR